MCNSSSKGSNLLFWFPWAPGTHMVDTYMQAKHVHTWNKILQNSLNAYARVPVPGCALGGCGVICWDVHSKHLEVLIHIIHISQFGKYCTLTFFSYNSIWYKTKDVGKYSLLCFGSEICPQLVFLNSCFPATGIIWVVWYRTLEGGSKSLGVDLWRIYPTTALGTIILLAGPSW